MSCFWLSARALYRPITAFASEGGVPPLACALMKAAPGDLVVLHAPAGKEKLQVLDVRYERIPMEPFTAPPGSESVTTPRPPTEKSA